MKKTIIFVLFLFLTVSLSACSVSKNENTENSVSNFKDISKPDFESPEEDPDLRGLVKSITGNEIVVLKLNTEESKRETTDKNEDKPELDEDKAEAFSLGTDNERSVPGSGGGGGMRGGPEGMANSGQRDSLTSMLEKFSGGEESVLIPVGIKMLKSSDSEDVKERTMVEASLEDITSEKMITVWLNKSIEDRNVAEFVLIN